MRYEILVDRAESPKKCSILPLAYREDLRIVRFDRSLAVAPLRGDLLLHPAGVPLDVLPPSLRIPPQDAVLSAVDCNWRRLDSILRKIVAPLPPLVRIPDGFETAYRRRNKRDQDPDGGLATIEALFLAAAFLGGRDDTLLREYAPAGEFLERNALLLQRYGLEGSPK